MTTPTLFVNKSYSMIFGRGSQRAIFQTFAIVGNTNLTVLMSARGGDMQRPKKIFNVQCGYCKLKSHTKDVFYKLVGCLPEFK